MVALPYSLSARGRGVAALGAVAGAIVCAAVVVGAATTGRLDDLGRGFVAATPFLLLAALLVPSALWIAARPQRGMLALAALVPFNGLLILVPGKPPFIEGWKEAVLLWTLLWAAFGSFGRVKVLRERPGYLTPLLLFIGMGAVSALVLALDGQWTRGLVGLKVGYFWMLGASVVFLAPLTRRDRDRVVSILMITGLFTSVLGLVQQRIPAERLVELGYEYDVNIRFTGGFVRSISSFPTPFNFAFFLTLVLLIGTAVSLEDPKRPRSVGFFATSPILALALAFTFVRGAWLALGVGLLVLAVRRYRVLLMPVPFALLGVLLLPGQFGTSAFQSESFNERTVGWGQNLDELLNAPFGRGLGTTGASAEKLADVAGLKFADVYQPDNQYFKVVYEIGVPGLWIFVLLFVAMILTIRRLEPRLSGDDLGLALGFGASIVGAMAASLVATWLEIFPNDFYLWFLLAVIVTATDSRAGDPVAGDPALPAALVPEPRGA